MKIIVNNCGDCPLRRVDKTGKVWCKTGKDMLLFGTDEGDPNYVTSETVHPECPMIDGRVTAHLAMNTKNAVTGRIESFLGNRIEISNGKRGVVVGKFKTCALIKFSQADLATFTEQQKKGTWYAMIPDGGGLLHLPEDYIVARLNAIGEFNYNDLYEFYFGFGECEDV